MASPVETLHVRQAKMADVRKERATVARCIFLVSDPTREPSFTPCVAETKCLNSNRLQLRSRVNARRFLLFFRRGEIIKRRSVGRSFAITARNGISNDGPVDR